MTHKYETIMEKSLSKNQEEIEVIRCICSNKPEDYTTKRIINIDKWFGKWYLMPDYGNVVVIMNCPWCELPLDKPETNLNKKVECPIINCTHCGAELDKTKLEYSDWYKKRILQ